MIFAVLAGGLYLLNSIVTEKFLVSQVESTLNCRMEIKKVNFNLFSIFSSLTIDGIKLAPRDLVSDKGTPLSERKPLESYLIGAKKIELQLSLLPLLEKRFELKKFIVHEPDVSLTLYKNGDNNLSPLLKTPKVVNGELNPAHEKKQQESQNKQQEQGSGQESETEKQEDEPFSIKTLPISAKLERIGIQNGKVRVFVQETAQKLVLSDWTIMIGFIDINPEDLKNHNSVDLTSSFAISVFGDSGETAKILFGTTGKVVPFVAETGYVNPVVGYTANLRKGTYVSGMAIGDALKAKIPLFSELGVTPKGLEQKAELQKDVSFKMTYGHGTITLKQAVVFPFTNFDFSLEPESWIQVSNNSHFFNASLLLTKEESKPVLDKIDGFLDKNITTPAVDKKSIREKLLASISKDSRIKIDFKSKGDLKSPDVTPLSNFSITGFLKDAVLGGLKNVLGDEIKKKLPGGLDKLF